MVTERLTNMGPVPKPLDQRFWAKVDYSGGPDACWPWLGSRDKHGYGSFMVGSTVNGTRHSEKAPRVAFHLTYPGLITNGDHVLHRCDNPPCCNPKHLFLGSQAINMADMRQKGRAQSARGEQKANAVLTDALVQEIRRLYESGQYSQRGVGKALGLNENTVKHVLTGASWQHVPKKAAGALLDGREWREIP